MSISICVIQTSRSRKKYKYSAECVIWTEKIEVLCEGREREWEGWGVKSIANLNQHVPYFWYPLFSSMQ